MAKEEQQLVQCVECGALIDGASAVLADDGGTYCVDCAQDVLRECDHCCRVVREDDLSDVHVQYGHADHVEQWCTECVDDYAFYCVECGERFDRRSNYHYQLPGGDWICEDCYDDGYCTCVECGDIICRDDAVERHGEWYCEGCAPDDDTIEDCYDDGYCTCVECGDVICRDDAVERHGEWYCEGCAPDDDTIHAYHCYSTDWHRHGADPLLDSHELKFPLIGWELEIDGGGEVDDNAREITAAMGFEAPESDMLKCSHDGSLNNGFEIISQPCTLEYHLGRSRFR